MLQVSSLYMPSGAILSPKGYECDFRTPEVIPYRMLQVSSLYMPSGALLAQRAVSAIFGLLRRFPIECSRSRLCTCLLGRFWPQGLGLRFSDS